MRGAAARVGAVPGVGTIGASAMMIAGNAASSDANGEMIAIGTAAVTSTAVILIATAVVHAKNGAANAVVTMTAGWNCM